MWASEQISFKIVIIPCYLYYFSATFDSYKIYALLQIAESNLHSLLRI